MLSTLTHLPAGHVKLIISDRKASKTINRTHEIALPASLWPATGCPTDHDLINTNPHEFQLKALKTGEEGEAVKQGK